MWHINTVYAENEYINTVIKQILKLNVLTGTKRHPTLKLRTTDGEMMASYTAPARTHRAPAKAFYFSKPHHPFIPLFMTAPQIARAVQQPLLLAMVPPPT
jgi:hypothetical protein